jgi:anti-sigma factor ChrR (cupin superfamily)
MNLQDNTYAAFMLDYAAGALSPAERLAADLHRALSPEGRRNAEILDMLGGLLLESGAGPVASMAGLADPDASAAPRDPAPSHLSPYIDGDLLALPWRKNIFGVKTLPTDMKMVELLRLDPGERAPQHGHGRRDVTVVLVGTFADEFGVYERGDLAFAEHGMKHEPRAVGDAPCVCLIATEAGRPLSGLLGLFGLTGRRSEAA